MKKTINIAILATVLSAAWAVKLHAELLNPMNFTSLGVFDVTNGNYVIDTDTLTISETNGVSTNVLFTNPVDPNLPQEFYHLQLR